MIGFALFGIMSAWVSLGSTITASHQELPVESRVRSAPPTLDTLDRKHRFAQCLVQRHRDQVVLILEQAPGSPAEAQLVHALGSRWATCSLLVTGRDVQTEAAVLRGPLAEALYETDFVQSPRETRSQRGPRRLARLPATYGGGSAGPLAGLAEQQLRHFAACVTAAAPADGVGIMATVPGSDAEHAQVERLVASHELCFRDESGFDINIPTVRGFVAEEAYRRAAASARRERVEAPSPRQRTARLAISQAGGTIGNGGVVRRLGRDDAGAILRFARCVADALPAEAEQALARHLAGSDEDQSLYQLARRRWMCSPEGRPILFSRALFAGGFAEALLERAADGSPSRFEPSALHRVAQLRSPPDNVALCIVRSAPTAVAELLATDPASPGEEQAVASLLPRGEECVPPDEKMSTSPQALRALVAVAAYRLTRLDPQGRN